MATDKEILQQFGQSISGGIKDNLAKTASHLDTFLINENNEAANSLRVQASDSSLEIFGSQYIGISEDGRGPTKNPGDGALRRAIIRYINRYNIKMYLNKKKGLDFSIKSGAYFWSQSIHKGGTPLNKRGGGSGVISDVITTQRVNTLSSTFATKYLNNVTSEILKAFKEK